MDSRINNIKRLIELKKENYPNISNIWLKYLEKKISILNESLDKAEDIFSHIEDNIKQDIPYSTIAILYLINQERLP
jgi:hypothetical protein